jgi:hypothetical protein
VSTYIPVNANLFNKPRLWVVHHLHRLACPAALGLIALLAGVLGFTRFSGGASAELSALVPTGSPDAVLEVRATHASREYDYVTVTGEAANLSARPIKNVEAVVEFFDRGGKLCKMETALLALPTALPGEETPFTVQTRDIPGMTSYRVRFRHLLGDLIPSR